MEDRLDESKYILNCDGISKSFGGTHALKKVQLHVKPGEVHALLGENGAGKSTLMKIVIGLYTQDEGSMTFRGKPYQARGPVDAIKAGISMIHQELNPEPHLTIAESIFLNREDTKGLLLDKKKTNEKARFRPLKTKKYALKTGIPARACHNSPLWLFRTEKFRNSPERLQKPPKQISE